METMIGNERPVIAACCHEPSFTVPVGGMVVCRNCGLVVDNVYVEDTRRSFTSFEHEDRRHHEPFNSPFGPRTGFGNIRWDSMGNPMSMSKRLFFSRLIKLQRSTFGKNERNYWQAKPTMKKMRLMIGMPWHVERTAWKIYKEAVNKKITRGRSISATVAASLHAAARVHGLPYLLDDFRSISGVDTRMFHRMVRMIKMLVIEQLDMNYRLLNPRSLVFRFGERLGVPIPLQLEAARLLEKAMKNIDGKDPRSFAVAAIYIVTKNTNHCRTQTDLAMVAGITEVTLRSRVREMSPDIPVLVPGFLIRNSRTRHQTPVHE